MPSTIELASGLVAGSVTTTIVHPLDLIKTRLQLDTTTARRFGRSFALARRIYRHEGGIAGLYRGLVPNVVGNASSWAFYFYCYDAIKTSMRDTRIAQTATLQASDYLIASAAAGLLTTLLTNPIWVVKTRMLSTSSSDARAYRSIFDGTKHILRTEGWRGFYRGLVPSAVGVSHGAVQFMIYEKFKDSRIAAHAQTPESPTNFELLIYSGSSKALAASVTYPYQVIRSRMQTYDTGESYKGLVDTICRTWRNERVAGFYKGLIPNVARIVPSSCVMFLAYENTKAVLSTSRVDRELQA